MELEAFRAQAQAWLAEHAAWAPRDYGAILPPDLYEQGVAWQRLLFADGWAGIHWPVEHGGRGLTIAHNAAWIEACARASVPAVHQHGRHRAGRRGHPAVRHSRAAVAPAAAHIGRRRRVVPALQRAGRRQRPRQPQHPGRARRRPVRGERPEGVVLGWPLQRLGHPDGPHRPGRGEAQRHLVLPARHAPAGRRGSPAQADDRRVGVRRGVLHRRAGASRLPARPAARGLERRHGRADPRARPHRRLGHRPRSGGSRACSRWVATARSTPWSASSSPAS